MASSGLYGCGCGSSFGSRKSRKRSRRVRRSHKKSRKVRRARRSHKRSHKRSRRFGIVAGPGFKAQTTYPNAFANYFGSAQPFVNASGWWYPQTGGQIQSPQMLFLNPTKQPGLPSN